MRWAETGGIVGNAELLFPVPGAEQDKSLRLATFLDAGQVFAASERPVAGRLPLFRRSRGELEFSVRAGACIHGLSPELESGRPRTEGTIYARDRVLRLGNGGCGLAD